MRPGWLPELVLFEHSENDWEKYLKVLYDYFLADFVCSKPAFRGKKVAIKRYPLAEDGKEATFWHIISEGDTEDERIPDLRRCERIRWPKPVIEHSEDNEIKVWENDRKGEKRICIWFEAMEYLVVLAKRKDIILFWTAYLITKEHRKKKLIKEFEEFKKAGDAQKGGAVTPSTRGR